ncbi:MAG: glutamate 5-kinase [Phycisphaerae bacterium]|nr:glutamate 5-kinase [Phycisphaerae bacterium]HON90544.1 glutamate 5-kinase [Sedimentisphaerales bacterium]
MRNFEKTKRVVIKIGTNTLAKDGGIDTAYFAGVADQVKALTASGRQVVIVTSGAIGMGAGQLGLTEKPREMKMRQACAAIGQPLLMREYRKAFEQQGVEVAQVLLTAEVLTNRKTYLNLRNAIETLLDLGVIPVLNENDSVSTAEIGTAFGDNDKLSALVASKIDADLLIMLTDIDALYDKNPQKHADAKPIPVVFEITEEILRNAGGSGSVHSTGGMRTKIEAAKIAANAGCRIVLANGREDRVISRIMAGEPLGTIFMPKRKLSNRARWILNSRPAGTIRIDDGAIKALRNHKSLLPSGVTGVEGTFKQGEVVMLNESAKAVTSLDSLQVKTLAGKHSREIKKLLGPDHRDVVATPEDIVFLDY